MKFVRKLRENRPPSESFQITENLSCGVWKVVGPGGSQRIHWKLSRVNPEGESFSLMRVEQLLEFPAAISILAGGFAQVPSLDACLREDLAKLERLLVDADARLKANGECEVGTDADKGIFVKS